MIISISRRKKTRSGRSIVLKQVMKHLSDVDLEKSVVNHDKALFENTWDKIRDNIAKEIGNRE